MRLIMKNDLFLQMRSKYLVVVIEEYSLLSLKMHNNCHTRYLCAAFCSTIITQEQ